MVLFRLRIVMEKNAAPFPFRFLKSPIDQVKEYIKWLLLQYYVIVPITYLHWERFYINIELASESVF